MGLSTPIKKYNYERSAYRWIIARHPQEFEAVGITPIILERAPAARKALYNCSWPGAQKLIMCMDGRFERTQFFDALIGRGLQACTRFGYHHLTEEERDALGIREHALTKKHYLEHFKAKADADIASGSKASSKRCKGKNEMQKRLWKTISGLMAPEIQGFSPERHITVTKAVRNGDNRVTTQIIIEINRSELPEDSSTGSSNPCSVPLSPCLNGGGGSSAVVPCDSSLDHEYLPSSGAGSGGGSSSSALNNYERPMKRLCVKVEGSTQPSSAVNNSLIPEMPELHSSVGEKDDSNNNHNISNGSEVYPPAAPALNVPRVWDSSELRMLDEVDVDILTSLF